MKIIRTYRCTVSNTIYDPRQGDPMSNIPPGTPFEDLPDSWLCPDCGASKADFELASEEHLITND